MYFLTPSRPRRFTGDNFRRHVTETFQTLKKQKSLPNVIWNIWMQKIKCFPLNIVHKVCSKIMKSQKVKG